MNKRDKCRFIYLWTIFHKKSFCKIYNFSLIFFLTELNVVTTNQVQTERAMAYLIGFRRHETF